MLYNGLQKSDKTNFMFGTNNGDGYIEKSLKHPFLFIYLFFLCIPNLVPFPQIQTLSPSKNNMFQPKNSPSEYRCHKTYEIFNPFVRHKKY